MHSNSEEGDPERREGGIDESTVPFFVVVC